MTFSSSFLFASRLLFPKTGKKSNARRSLFGAMICIGISLVPLIMVLTVSNGMIKGITDRMIGLSSSHLQFVLYPNSIFSEDKDSLYIACDVIKSGDKNIKNVYPELQGIALASSPKGRFGASVRAVNEDIFEVNESFKNLFDVLEGNTNLSLNNSCIIGKKLAENLSVHVGETIRLITLKENSSGKMMPKITPLKINGIVSSGYQELDSLWIFISLDLGFKLISQDSGNYVIGIETDDAFSVNLEKTYRNLGKLLAAEGKLYRWNQLNSAQYENFASTQIMLIFIMMLIVLVASVNISSALVMLVMERKKEIAIIKSLGGTSKGISLSFILTGGVTGFFGVLFGLPLGIICSINFSAIMGFLEKIINFFVRNFYIVFHGNLSEYSHIYLLDPAFYLQKIPLEIPFLQIFFVALGTILLSFLVSLLPSLKAGREKPIETLRKI